ncbi:MAG: glycine cleavage system protein GcvH [Bacilli bacterium]|jgi:glycine cleavage system H protein|nr:glycine cleavage system protein GcvH [Bacilli bacterium]MDD2681739.1 glycine cleavage system protein GcvH [Bacilli bacterium]MDD3121013.1 glycine cleavage system protein GcvH [Bacilli bacterium]MDD4063187.1 glycine cleavage system protein GcvH [Bacilli bacterium]MDD4481827.1 glycine cleavage system protein GcvH [Bacilli bacterium]
MSKVLKNLKYASSHEWIKVEGNVGIIGISDYAQDSLGNIVFLDVPEVGDVFNKGDEFGVLESVKAASDLYLPVGGEVIDVNLELVDSPELLNESAYDNWILKISIADLSELDDLLTAEEYEAETK